MWPEIVMLFSLLIFFCILLAIKLSAYFISHGCCAYTVGLKYGASRASNLSLFQKSPMVNFSPGIPILS